jgi:hypothetical protein
MIIQRRRSRYDRADEGEVLARKLPIASRLI